MNERFKTSIKNSFDDSRQWLTFEKDFNRQSEYVVIYSSLTHIVIVLFQAFRMTRVKFIRLHASIYYSKIDIIISFLIYVFFFRNKFENQVFFLQFRNLEEKYLGMEIEIIINKYIFIYIFFKYLKDKYHIFIKIDNKINNKNNNIIIFL